MTAGSGGAPGGIAPGSGQGAEVLIWNQGEGRQPAPPYPWQARLEGQEGTVRIRFCVGPHGRVIWAELLESCPWPLLQKSALNTVRHSWRFRAGPTRIYEVEIRFELTRMASAGRV